MSKPLYSLNFLNALGAVLQYESKTWDSEEECKAYYFEIWKKYNLEKINNGKIATNIFDACVEMGGAQAFMLVCRTIEMVLKKSFVECDIQTMHIINELDPEEFLRLFKFYRADKAPALLFNTPKIDKQGFKDLLKRIMNC